MKIICRRDPPVRFRNTHAVRLSAGVRIVESEVQSTTDSLEALEIFRRNPAAFDLVITDQTMPHMTGTELAQELAGLRSDIPIILCTGYSEIVDRDTAKELGIRALLTKPVSRSELSETIRRALEETEQA